MKAPVGKKEQALREMREARASSATKIKAKAIGKVGKVKVKKTGRGR